MVNNELVGGWPTHLKNMSSSVGMMTFPIYRKIKTVPNHQPVNGEIRSQEPTEGTQFSQTLEEDQWKFCAVQLKKSWTFLQAPHETI